MPYLIKGANVFTPKFLGKKDVLILGNPDVQNFKYQNSFSAELLLLSVF